MEAKIILTLFIRHFKVGRSDIPLRLTAKFLYEPADDRLVVLEEGGFPFRDNSV